jgi:catecholate siderophore receptor
MKYRTFASLRKSSSPRRRGRTRLFVLGAAFAASAIGTRSANATPAPAQQQQGPSAAGEPQATRTLRFDIREGALASVLAQFEQITGLTVVLADPGLGVITSAGVVGTYSPLDALRRLLAGTSVGVRTAADGTVTLGVGGVSETVNVEGELPTVTSRTFTEPLRDIPRTINVIPQSLIQEQGATTLRDVLRNVPGITFQAGEGGVPAGDQLTIRGFSARTDMFIDGVRDFGGYARDSFNLEQVEVAKGPSSATSGRGSTGGSINQVSKTPGMGKSYSASIGGGNASYVRSSADINQPLGEGAALRLNAMWTDAGVPGRDAVESERWGVAPSLAFGINKPTTLTVSHMHLEQDNVPEYGLPWVPANTNPELAAYSGGEPPVDSENFYGLVTRDYEDTKTDVSTVQVDHRVNPGLTLRNLTRFGRNDRDSVITAPRFASVNTSTAINRQLQSRDMVDKIVANQSSAIGRFTTGTIGHALSTGFELAYESSENFARSGPSAPQADLFNPDPTQPYPGPITRTGASTKGAASTVSAYAFDTVNLGSHVELSGGLRWDRFDADSDSIAVTGVSTTLERVDNFVSWRAGAVYKPKTNGSLYVGYGTSANPSAEGLALTSSTVELEPEQSRTFEVGTKWDLANARLSATSAYFHTEKINARTPGVNPGDPPTVLAGEQRVQGIELGLSGRITRQWSVYSGYAFMDSVIPESNTLTEVDNALALTPNHTFNLWTTYELPLGVSLGGGVQYMDAVFRNASNITHVPSYWLTNVLASYRVNQFMTLRFNGQNLTDKHYVDRIGGGHYIPGAGRQLIVSSDFRF